MEMTELEMNIGHIFIDEKAPFGCKSIVSYG
jgi:hypothetical protein